jgi:hypothetical protein
MNKYCFPTGYKSARDGYKKTDKDQFTKYCRDEKKLESIKNVL